MSHEFYHVADIEKMGWASFYGRWFVEMLKYGFNGAYNHEGTLENDAKLHEISNQSIYYFQYDY